MLCTSGHRQRTRAAATPVTVVSMPLVSSHPRAAAATLQYLDRCLAHNVAVVIPQCATASTAVTYAGICLHSRVVEAHYSCRYSQAFATYGSHAQRLLCCTAHVTVPHNLVYKEYDLAC